MENLKEILKTLDKFREELKLEFDDNIMLDCAVRIFNSQNIQKDKPQKQESKDEPLTDKQKWLLKKAKEEGIYKGELDISKKQASSEIKKIKEKYG